MRYTTRQPTAPGEFYWVRRLNGSDHRVRIAELVLCDAMDKRPAGSLKLCFTNGEESWALDGYEFAGPITVPFSHPKSPDSDAVGEHAEPPFHD